MIMTNDVLMTMIMKCYLDLVPTNGAATKLFSNYQLIAFKLCNFDIHMLLLNIVN